MTKEAIIKAVEMRKEGLPLGAIAKKLGTSYANMNVIFCRLRKDGVHLPRISKKSGYTQALESLKQTKNAKS